jgi:hypothetical protein
LLTSVRRLKAHTRNWDLFSEASIPSSFSSNSGQILDPPPTLALYLRAMAPRGVLGNFSDLRRAPELGGEEFQGLDAPDHRLSETST